MRVCAARAHAVPSSSELWGGRKICSLFMALFPMSRQADANEYEAEETIIAQWQLTRIPTDRGPSRAHTVPFLPWLLECRGERYCRPWVNTLRNG